MVNLLALVAINVAKPASFKYLSTSRMAHFTYFYLMNIDIIAEIEFRTARSGGSGGQNVNKVETMVEGRWNVDASLLVGDAQKILIHQRLANKITGEGLLLVKSQTARTQLDNKANVVEKMNQLVNQSLIKKKIRIATHPSKAAKERRIEGKKRNAFIKQQRSKINKGDY